MKRDLLRAEISSELQGRQLVWFGTRGDDVEPAAELPELAASFSVIAPYRRRPSVESLSLEEISGTRVDLDAHDIDDEPKDGPAGTLRQAILRALSRPSVLFTYRPSRFVSALGFARQDRCEYVGLFKDHQSAFEHKPWVESEVTKLGIPHIPWTYVADEEQLSTLRALDEGALVLRRSRTSGGTGLFRVESKEDLQALWPEQDEEYVSVAPFFEQGLPLNVSGVVWHDGVTLHPASVQLIGLPTCTVRPFGYCGNDFGAVQDLDPAVLEQVERSTELIAGWLGRHGYLGAFGVDFLVHQGRVLFTEVNPRFQGSTHPSGRIAADQGESCLVLEHLAALQGRGAPPSLRLRDWQSGERSHLVVHWTGSTPAHLDPTPVVSAVAEWAPGVRTDATTSPSLLTDPGATVTRMTFDRRLTSDGFSIPQPLASILASWSERTASDPRDRLDADQEA